LKLSADAARKPGPIATLIELTKLRISVASTVTAAAGYIACLRHADAGLATTLAGILLMAMGASATNEVQERQFDARMPRTRTRPVPRGVLGVRVALLIAGGLAAAGFLVLLLAHGPVPAFLGALAMAWYNALYTPLKRVSAFAVVPGALIGALPPAIGWTAAGGDAKDPTVLALAFVFFIWQVPHFWMLVALHAEGYEAAGFPTILKLLGRQRLARLSFTWICGTAAACALLPMFRAVVTIPALFVLAGASVWLICSSAPLLRPDPGAAVFRRAFLRLNAFALLLTMALVLDPLVQRGGTDVRSGTSRPLPLLRQQASNRRVACQTLPGVENSTGLRAGRQPPGNATYADHRFPSQPTQVLTMALSVTSDERTELERRTTWCR
jgi:protoheme IX farnesyltransferase